MLTHRWILDRGTFFNPVLRAPNGPVGQNGVSTPYRSTKYGREQGRIKVERSEIMFSHIWQ